MATPKLTILLSGMIAGVPHQGGATWAILQYLLGFKRLGYNVHFIEPVEQAALRPAGVPLARSDNAAYFRRVMAEFGMGNHQGCGPDLHAAVEQDVQIDGPRSPAIWRLAARRS